MAKDIVITGIGLVTPLGSSPEELLRRIEAGESAARTPTRFDASPFACRLAAEIDGFRPEDHVPEPKTVRLMNRDAQLAVAAARAAMKDAGLVPGGALLPSPHAGEGPGPAGRPYPSDEVALYGATGLAGLALAEVAALVRYSASADGSFDPRRFGAVALKRVRPVLSFKILSNMPVSFISIFENIRGPNAVYNPWEGQGAQAIAAGLGAVARGEAAAALVGGCDWKTHELAFLALQQQGVFDSWRRQGAGGVPGEGAAFLILEDEERARRRGAPLYARLAGCAIRTARPGARRAAAYEAVLAPLVASSGGAVGAAARSLSAAQSQHAPGPFAAVVAAADGDPALADDEERALGKLGVATGNVLRPKRHVGNLFAAAAAVQVALAAALVKRLGPGARILAHSFGHGSEQAAFVLEST